MERISKDMIKVKDDQGVWYIMSANDSTHLYMGNNPEGVRSKACMLLHVGQLSHRPYYDQLGQWLIDQYQAKMKAH